MLEECTRNKIRKLLLFVVVSPHPGYFFPLIFREWEERETETHRERNIDERDTSIGCLPHVHQPDPGIEPTTQVRPFDGESNPWPFGMQADPEQEDLTFILFFWGGMGG